MSADRRPLPWLLTGLGAVLALAATPPAWASWTPALVVPALAVQFALATGERRPLLASYLLGALHIGAFSWSLRHVAYSGWLAIVLLGGLYPLAVAVATRRSARFPTTVFAIAVAGAAWLRAEMPGIGYPHGQPCHALAVWPILLGSVRIGGEALLNALLAGIAAATVQWWRSWRVAVPPMRAARRAWAGWVAVTAAITFVAAPLPRSELGPTVSIAAIEPGLHPFDAYADIAPGDERAYEQRTLQLLRDRFLEPTRRLATAAAPRLVLWPESSVPFDYRFARDGSVRTQHLLGAFELPAGARVCIGSGVERGGRVTPVAALLDERGSYLDHHEKQRLVPAGETLPGLEWLPESWSVPLRRWLQTAVGVPVALPGARRPPLSLPARGGEPAVPFAALICYDNAYPAVAAAAVADGARFVAVLSNEAWYRGGGEQDQLVAITVLTAVATSTPFVRCTTDGWSMAVDRDGHLLAALPRASAPQPESRVLRVDLPLGDGCLPPLASLHPWLGRMAGAAVVLALLHALWSWARLLRLGHPLRQVGSDPGPKPW